MRARLATLLAALMMLALLAFGIPLAWTLASSVQRDVYVDRLADASRFASLVRQAAEGGDLTAVTADLERYEEVYGIRGAVLDRRGEPVATSTTPPDLGAPAAAEAVTVALNGRREEPPGAVPPWSDAPLVVTEPVVQGGDVVGVVVTASPTQRLHAEVLRSWTVLAAVMAVALAASVVLSVRLAAWVLRPVRVLDDAVHAVGTGQLGTRVPEGGGPPELRRLAGAFNEMADGVQALVDQQRAFVADASHQLRNPLSALALRLEEARLTLPPSAAGTLDASHEEVERLAAVLDELLELARAENADAAPVPVDAAEVLTGRAEAWSGLAARRGVELRVDVAAGPAALTVLASPQALGSALDALIDNALKFSPDGATVLLRGEARHPDEVVLTVVDEGAGLEPEELGRAADRFWRSPRHTNVPGSGLGLAVATALVQRWGGRLDLRPGDERGLEVSLHLHPPTRPAPSDLRRPVVRQRSRVQLERRGEDGGTPVEGTGQGDRRRDLGAPLEQQAREGLRQAGVHVGPDDQDIGHRERLHRGGEVVHVRGDRRGPVDGETGGAQDPDRLDDGEQGDGRAPRQVGDAAGRQPA